MIGAPLPRLILPACGSSQYAGDVVMRRYGHPSVHDAPGYWIVRLVPDCDKLLDFFGLTQAAHAGVLAVVDDFGTLVPVGARA